MKTQALLMDAATSDAILIPMLADEDADSDIRGVEDADRLRFQSKRDALLRPHAGGGRDVAAKAAAPASAAARANFAARMCPGRAL